MFVVKVYCKIFHDHQDRTAVNVHHEHSIVPTNRPLGLPRREKLDSILFTNPITSLLTFEMTKLPLDEDVKKC